MWLLHKPQSKIKTTNRSLYFGNFKLSLLKGIFGTLRKQLQRDFQNTFCQVFVFLPCEGLLVIHVISSGLSHFAISAVRRDTVSDGGEFGRGSLFLLMFLARLFSGNPDCREFVGLLKPPGSLMKMQALMLIQS